MTRVGSEVTRPRHTATLLHVANTLQASDVHFAWQRHQTYIQLKLFLTISKSTTGSSSYTGTALMSTSKESRVFACSMRSVFNIKLQPTCDSDELQQCKMSSCDVAPCLTMAVAATAMFKEGAKSHALILHALPMMCSNVFRNESDAAAHKNQREQRNLSTIENQANAMGARMGHA